MPCGCRRHVSCADVHCLLCAQSQNRRCPRTFSPKYLAGDVLKAGCGATLRCAPTHLLPACGDTSIF